VVGLEMVAATVRKMWEPSVGEDDEKRVDKEK
jgi:hypothetical protein